jgi:hypothetical protein
MAYELSFDMPFEYEDALRTLIGVDNVDLKDEDINSPVIAGAAELELLKQMPTVTVFMADEGITELNKTRVGLAFVNMMAYMAYPGLRVKVLQMETDGKSIGARFKDAMQRDRAEFMADALGYLVPLHIYLVGDDVKQLEFVSPATDVVIGV